MKLLKYSLVLAGLFFVSAIIPGIICVLFGFNGVWSSSGISLAIVCLLKGKIAKKIFGQNTHHQSSPNTAFLLFALSLISGGIKAFTYYSNKTSMERLGFIYESTREQVFNQLFIPLFVASLFWAIVLGIITYIRGKQKKYAEQDIEFKPNPIANLPSQVTENKIDNKEPLDTNCTSEKQAISCDSQVKIASKADNAIIVKKWWNAISVSLRKKRKSIWVTLTSIVFIILVLLFLSKIKPDYNSVGEYLYEDSFGNIHVDKNCSKISSVSVMRIELENLNNENFQHFCHICVSDEIYGTLKERHNNRVVEQRLSNIYNVLIIYNISNIPSNKEDFRMWIESEQGNLIYLFKIMSLMRVSGIGDNVTAFKLWLYSDDESKVEISTAIMRLYDTCKRERLNVGDFNEFLMYIQSNEGDMQWIIYNKLVELDYDMEDYQHYHETVTALIPYESIE